MSQSGRQELNLPLTVYQTVASPLGYGPKINALYGTRTRLACSTGRSPHPLRHRAGKSVRRESHPPVRLGRSVPGCSATDTSSKGGRSRTLCVRVGAALLSQEHTLVTAEGTGLEPARAFASPAFQAGAIMPVGLPFRMLPIHSFQRPARDSHPHPSG